MPVSVLMPHVYKEKKDPLDVLAQGLKIAESVYGLKVDMEKMDDYRKNRDLMQGVRDGDEKAIEQYRRQSRMENLVTDEQLSHIFKDSKVLERKPQDGDNDYLEIGTTAGLRYVKPPRTGEDGWTGKDFANFMQKGGGVSETQVENSLRIKGTDGKEYFLTAPKAKGEKEQPGRPYPYLDSQGRARVGNWDGKNIIKDELNDPLSANQPKIEKPPVRKEGQGGGFTKDDVHFISKNLDDFWKGSDIVKQVTVSNISSTLPSFLDKRTAASDRVVKDAWRIIGNDNSAPSQAQTEGMGGESLSQWVPRFWGKKFESNSPQFTEIDRRNMKMTSKLALDNASNFIRQQGRIKADQLASVSNGISSDEWYQRLGVENRIKGYYDKLGDVPSGVIEDQKQQSTKNQIPVAPSQVFSPEPGYPTYLREKKAYDDKMKIYNDAKSRMKQYLGK